MFVSITRLKQVSIKYWTAIFTSLLKAASQNFMSTVFVVCALKSLPTFCYDLFDWLFVGIFTFASRICFYILRSRSSFMFLSSLPLYSFYYFFVKFLLFFFTMSALINFWFLAAALFALTGPKSLNCQAFLLLFCLFTKVKSKWWTRRPRKQIKLL